MKLYALCDQDILDEKGVSLEQYLEIANAHKAEILQYRNKNADIAFIKQQLIFIRKYYAGCLIVNDSYELIEFCDGVHLGQEDLKIIDEDVCKAVKIIRNTIGSDKILGISTHNKEEVIQSNDMDINYIGLGAYRNTNTKKDLTSILGNSLDTIAARSNHLVAAIGGVKLSDIFENVTYHVIGNGLIESK